MAKSSSKKRERTDEDVADNHDAKPAVKKSKIDSNGKAEVTKKSSKVKEAKSEPAATEEAPKAKKEKKEKKDKKEKAEKAEKKDKKEDKAEKAEKEEKKDKKDKKEKRDKKEKKDKKTKAKDVEPATESDSPEQAAPSAPEPATKQAANGDKKSKKQKKGKKQPTTTSSSDTPTNGADEPATTTTTTDEPTTNGKQNRFICFVGNLPFTATADEVRAHFASLQPTSVRLLTQRDNPSKSRGIAFVEFAGYDHMKTCLAKFHHSEFDDGSAQPRRINVELTFVSPPPANHPKPILYVCVC